MMRVAKLVYSLALLVVFLMDVKLDEHVVSVMDVT